MWLVMTLDLDILYPFSARVATPVREALTISKQVPGAVLIRHTGSIDRLDPCGFVPLI
jgi:hypothetical protein